MKGKAQWKCKYGKYGKYENDGLWSIKWMRWTIADEMNGIDFRWSSGKMI